MADIAVISVAVVALGTPLINGYFAARQSKQAARSERLDELRSVLDDAAVALLQFMDSVPRPEDTPRGAQAVEARLPLMKSALMKVWEQEARIGVRLGAEREVFKAYKSAHNSAGNYLEYYKDWLRSPPREGGKLQDIDNQLAAAHRKFFDLAAALTGPGRK